VDQFTPKDLQDLLTPSSSPCISLYLPTHRGWSEQDPIRWRSLLRDTEEQLTERGMRSAPVREFLQPMREQAGDPGFWRNQSDGLAFFHAPALTRSFRLPMPFDDLAVVGDGFHLKPLLPLLSEDGRYYVLAISRHRVRLLLGTRFSVQDIDLKGMPQSPEFDDLKTELLFYFRRIDRAIGELLRKEHTPLVLASVETFWPVYRKANTYKHLLEGGLAGNPDHLSAEELHERTWPLILPRFRVTQRKAIVLYAQLAGTGRTSDDLASIVAAAHHGQVECLLAPVDEDRWGTYDAATGAIRINHPAHPGDVELTNLAAMHVLLHGGKVHLIDPEKADMLPHLPAAVYWRPHAQKKSLPGQMVQSVS
jgi:hypothetical protein